jgi:hypothetical protein
VNAYTLLELERCEALASELHPDHWPPWLAQLARCIETGDPWWADADGSRRTTGLAVALVGAHAEAKPRAHRAWRKTSPNGSPTSSPYSPLTDAVIP